MTNKEAIERITRIKIYGGMTIPASMDDIKALDMTIKALKEPPTGEWVRDDDDFLCSRCNCGTHQPTLMGTPMFAFCPFCGVKIEEEEKK